jgi:type VI secretion system protein ImpJ
LTLSTKVLWGEGLFLRPQHFQHLDAYHESRLHELSQTLHPYAWGVRACKIDTDALINSRFRLDNLSVIFPDGELYQAPNAGMLPTEILLSDIPASNGQITIYLALPRLKPNGKNLFDDRYPMDITRYEKSNIQAHDLFSCATMGEVTRMTPTVRLLTADKLHDSYLTLPLARLKQRSSGGFEIDGDFLAPCVSLKAATSVHTQLRNLLESLQAKVQALYATHREPSKDIMEFRSGDIASFWLLHTCSAACASLTHLYQHPDLHPERLYQDLLRLAGGLLTFSKTHQLHDLPPYDHLDPAPSFAAVFGIIRSLVDTVISARYLSIPLTEVKQSHHQGSIASERIDERTLFYLGVGSDMAGTELAETVPRTIKIGSPDTVEALVSSSLPGIPLRYLAQVPSAIPVRPGMLYFSLEPRGSMYEQMSKGQTITIFIPSAFKDFKLELIALTS